MNDGTRTNWGIISSAAIGRRALAPAIHAARNARLVCIGTPNGEKVREEAAKFGCRILPSYEAVLADPDVDAVYNPLPNGMHADWTIRALRAGKHVLCEKPFSVTPAESVEMIAAARETGRWLMEAFMYRFHPQISLAKELLDAGRIGTLRLVRTRFTFNSPPNPANPRFQADQGPGALLDVGCYCVNATRFFSDGPPRAVSAWAAWEPVSGGDRSCAGLLEYEGHAGLFDCSFESAGRSGIELVGSAGTLEIPRPWLPGTDPGIVRLAAGDSVEEHKTGVANHYALMVEHFSDCIQRNCPPQPGPEDALENMQVLAAIRASAREGRRVILGEPVGDER